MRTLTIPSMITIVVKAAGGTRRDDERWWYEDGTRREEWAKRRMSLQFSEETIWK